MEVNIVKFIQSGANPFWDVIFKSVTYAGSFYALAIMFMIFYYGVNKKYAFSFLVGSIGACGANFALKHIINRPRPWQASNLIEAKTVESGYSMPSGHSQTVASVASGACMYKKAKRRDNVITIAVFSIIAILVAFSRLYLGHHYLTDVVCGLILGAVVTSVAIYIVQKIKWEEWIAVAMAGAGVLLCIVMCTKLFMYDEGTMELFIVAGVASGLGLGYFLEKRYVGFDVSKVKPIHRIWLTVVGICLVGILYLILSFVPKINAFLYICYFIIGLFATYYQMLILKGISKKLK